MADFATPEDVVSRWRPFRDDAERKRAEVLLGDASALLRSAVRTVVPDLDVLVAADPQLARVATMAVFVAVKRVLRNPDGAKAVQETIGPDRSYGLTFDGEATGVFFTAEELTPFMPDPDAAASHLTLSLPYR